jgi:cell division protein FtsB
MANFGTKKSIASYVYTRPVLLILFVIAFFLAISVYNRYLVEQEMLERTLRAEQTKEELLKRKSALEEKVEYLSGERGVEEEIRTHFDVAKEGEKVIILMGEDSEPVVEEVQETTKPWYKFW